MQQQTSWWEKGDGDEMPLGFYTQRLAASQREILSNVMRYSLIEVKKHARC